MQKSRPPDSRRPSAANTPRGRGKPAGRSSDGPSGRARSRDDDFAEPAEETPPPPAPAPLEMVEGLEKKYNVALAALGTKIERLQDENDKWERAARVSEERFAKLSTLNEVRSAIARPPNCEPPRLKLPCPEETRARHDPHSLATTPT